MYLVVSISYFVTTSPDAFNIWMRASMLSLMTGSRFREVTVQGIMFIVFGFTFFNFEDLWSRV